MPFFPLGTDLGIEASIDLKHRLAAHLQRPACLQLDGSAIARVHTASLQLLSALFRSRQHAGLETHWVAASPALREAARLLGLSALLGLTATPETRPHAYQSASGAQGQDVEIAA